MPSEPLKSSFLNNTVKRANGSTAVELVFADFKEAAL
jgi:hypothetical protein